MKQVLVAMLTLFIIHTASAQDALAPEFKNQPMLLKDGKLIPLEKQTAEIKKHGGYSGGYGYYGGGSAASSENLHLDGKQSNVRVSAKPTFMIKVDAETDPETVFYLAITEKAKKGREVELTKHGAFGAGKSVKRLHIKLEFEKVSPGVYRVRPAETLEEQGEYAFVNVTQSTSSGNSTLFAFGVGSLDN